MPTIHYNRRATPEEMAAGIDRRGEVIDQLEARAERAEARLAEAVGAIRGLVRITEAVRMSAGLQGSQIKRLDEAKAFLFNLGPTDGK